MMQILMDGWTELGNYWIAILPFFLVATGYGLWLSRLFPGDWKNQFWILLPFSLVAGLVPIEILALVFSALGWIWVPLAFWGNIIVLVLGLAGLLSWLVKYSRTTILGKPIYLFIAGAFLVLIYLTTRLAFLRSVVFPPYSDGMEHYLMARDLLSPGTAPAGSYKLLGIIEKFYHFGFHGLIVWQFYATGVPLESAMLVTGQLLLVFISIAVFFFLGIVTGRASISFAGAILSSIGWIMPGYAVNWSKYPALVGLAIFPVIAGMVFITWRAGRWNIRCWTGCLLLLCGATLSHSRTLVCLFLLIASVLTTCVLFRAIPKKAGPWMAILSGILVTILFIRVRFLTPFYCAGNCMILIGVALSMPLAAFFMPRFTFGTIGFLAASIGAYYFHLPAEFQRLSYVWLDGPFLEIMVYLPLSIIGGVAFGGIGTFLRKRKWIKTFIISALILAGLFTALKNSSFYADPSCNFVHQADLEAFLWIDENLPEDAVVIASGYAIDSNIVGTNGGVWIQPLTGRKTSLMPLGTNWDSLDVLKKVCQLGDVYIYDAGSAGFESVRLTRDDWFHLIYYKEDVRIYQITACIRDRDYP